MVTGLSHMTFIVKDFERASLFWQKIFMQPKFIRAEIRPERKRVLGEGSSIYFYDFDNHPFALHTGTLDERLAQYS